MSAFDFQKLDVYRAAIEYIVVSHALIERLPRGRGYLVDQLQRAATSIAANIAEGAGERATLEKARFYRMARRSAFECAALLDVIAAEHLGDETELRNGRELLERIGMMLTRLVTAARRTDSDTETTKQPDPDAESDSDSGTPSHEEA